MDSAYEVKQLNVLYLILVLRRQREGVPRKKPEQQWKVLYHDNVLVDVSLWCHFFLNLRYLVLISQTRLPKWNTVDKIK